MNCSLPLRSLGGARISLKCLQTSCQAEAVGDAQFSARRLRVLAPEARLASDPANLTSPGLASSPGLVRKELEHGSTRYPALAVPLHRCRRRSGRDGGTVCRRGASRAEEARSTTR